MFENVIETEKRIKSSKLEAFGIWLERYDNLIEHDSRMRIKKDIQ